MCAFSYFIAANTSLSRDCAPSCKPGGFALILVLILVAVVGMALAAAATVWTTTSTREREQQLLWTGLQFRDAIASYAKSSPGAAQYPKRLEDLLEDPRFPNLKRHLRQIYRDPFTGEAQWGLVKAGDFIIGVYSLAPGVPIKKAGFARGLESFSEASSYGDWKFVASAGSAAATQTGAPIPAPPPTSGLPAPVAPVAAASPAQPEPARSPAEEQRRQQQCDTQRKSENEMCNLYALPSGRAALLECQRSVDQRHEYCVNDPRDGSLQPGLDIPSQ